MAHEIVVPILDQTGDDVILLAWLKDEGDEVQPGDAICEVETAKATVDIQAEASGILRRKLIETGRSIPALTVVALVADADEPLPSIDPFYRTGQAATGSSAAAHEPAAAATPVAASNPPPVPTPPARPGRIAASPRAKRLAVDHGIALEDITGTGPHGSIVEEDVRRAIAQTSSASSGDRVAQAKAQHVVEAWRTIPHFYMNVTADLTQIRARKEQDGPAFTYTDYVAQAIAHALTATPELNGHWVDDHLHIQREVHLGIVVQTERGLVIPVLRNLAEHTIATIAAERQRLIEHAHAGKMSSGEVGGATFTLSNVGAGQIDSFTAIISPPQVAILAVGSVQRQPIIVGEQLEIRPVVTLTLGADHRAIDGRQSAAFLQRLKELLEA